MFLFINQYPIIKVDYTEVQPYEDKDEILMQYMKNMKRGDIFSPARRAETKFIQTKY